MFCENASHVSSGRYLAFSSKGYVGCVPPESEVDDWLFLPFGGRVGFVVRKVEVGVGKGKWLFVGDAYVHGVMGGEALVDSDGSGLEGEVVTLV